MIEATNRTLEVVAGPFIPEIPAFEVKLMGFGAFGWANVERLFFRTSKFCLEHIAYLFCNLALYGENIC